MLVPLRSRSRQMTYHVDANAAMNKQANTIMTIPIAVLLVPSGLSNAKAPSEAKIRKHMNIQAAPAMRHLRLPNRSTMYNPGNVVTTFTAPSIICVKKLFDSPTLAKIVVPAKGQFLYPGD